MLERTGALDRSLCNMQIKINKPAQRQQQEKGRRHPGVLHDIVIGLLVRPKEIGQQGLHSKKDLGFIALDVRLSDEVDVGQLQQEHCHDVLHRLKGILPLQDVVGKHAPHDETGIHPPCHGLAVIVPGIRVFESEVFTRDPPSDTINEGDCWNEKGSRARNER